MTDDDSTNVDDYSIRCPRLGNAVTFSYCRHENSGLPCFKTRDCWFQFFAVEEHLRKILTQEEWEKAFEQPKPSKVQSLIELIEAAKKRAGQ